MPDDYEEKYLALRDENTALKRKKNEQEATIKRMYTKLAMIEEALKKKRQADDKKAASTTAASDNQHDVDASGSKADGAVLPVRRDVDAEKFIQVLRSENAALRKKNQALAEKNRLLVEKLATRSGKSTLSSSAGPLKAGKAAAAKRASSNGPHRSTGTETAALHGSDIDSQVQSARKLHRDAFPGKLEVALKSRLVLAEKQLVKLQKENEQLRAGVKLRRSARDNNDSDGASDDNNEDEEGGKPRVVKLSSVEVEHMKRELRERQAQLAILNARYENLEANALAEREIQEKTLEQMEQMNRQVHKLRTQLQDVQMEREELEIRASKHSELDKEVESLREQNHRLETRMTALCESPFINDAFQRKERIDRLFDLEKLTQQQKDSITRLTDENHKLQQLVKEIQGNVKQMKQTKYGVEAELQRVKQLLVEERNTRSAAVPVQMQITPRQPVVTAPSKPVEPIVVTIPTRQPDRRDASSSPLHAAQPPKTEPTPAYGASVVVARKYEDLMLPVSDLLDPECTDVKSVKHLRNRVHMLQIAHLKSIQELERCEKMLQTQTDINRELSLEIEQLTTQEIAASSALQKQMRDTELLCQERLQRIQRLEAEIRQLKYLRGKADALKSREAVEDDAESSDDDEDDAVSIPESLVLAASELAPGEQLVELWVRGATFDRKMVGDNASTFVLCDFLDFESQATSLMVGSQPEYNLSATFKVTVDGFFLRYLATETLTLEVHQAVRGDFQVVGRASIRLARLLQSRGAIKEPELTIYRVESTINGEKKVSMGSLDVVLRLSMPISEIWRLHLQSFPQDIELLSLTTKRSEVATEKDDSSCNEAAMETGETQLNELRVAVFACRGLVSSSKTSGRRPSAYVHYQLLGFPDIFTNIVPESSTPEFDLECSRQAFVLQVDACLLRFFSKCQLWFTVFDDQVQVERSGLDGGMIGKCGVFLSELVEGNRVMGWRPLLNDSNQPVGEISMLIEWSNPFQVLAVGSAQSGRGMNDRTADLHVLNLDQQHSILQAFSSSLNGRVNYRQFLLYTSPPEELELLTAKIKERLEAAMDNTHPQSKTVEDLLVPATDRTGHSTDALIATQQLATSMDKLGIVLVESDLDCLRKYFGAPHPASAPTIQQDKVALGYLFMHVNPRLSCRDRLLCHKLRHTVRGFAKQRSTIKSVGAIQSPVQAFERFDVQREGYVSRAEFRRVLSVLGFELQSTDEEYRSLVEAKLERTATQSEPKAQRSVDAVAVDGDKLIDDEDELREVTQPVRSQANNPLSSSVLDEPQPVSISAVQPKQKPAKLMSTTSTSATDEFQRRKQAFTDRMKAIASASSKSLVYEQIEKKQLQQRRQLDAAPRPAKPVDMAAIDERLDRFHREQAAARTLQKQFRVYKSGESDASVGILESDVVLSKLLKNWSSSELEEWADEVADLIEDQVPRAKRAKAVSRKQLGFFLSKAPRMALPVGLLRQLMDHFSVQKLGSGPPQAVAYRSLLDFIRLTSTDDVEKEKLSRQPLWKVLHSISMDVAHALETFETTGDVQGSGIISFRKFHDAMSRLNVELPPRDRRLLLIALDVSGVEVLYHAFLTAISQLPASQELVRTMTRCRRFGVAALREKVIAQANSSDDGTVSTQELHDVLMQLDGDFVAKDAHILARLASNNSASSLGGVRTARVSLDELFKHLSRFASRQEPSPPLESLNKYPVAALQGLARNCRKFLTGSHNELQAAFERFDWQEAGIVSLAEFVSIARRSGFAVFTDTQLKTVAKLFGVKLAGRFGVNFRQFLDWTTPVALPAVEAVEAKLRGVAQDRAQLLPSKQLTDVLASWRQVFARYAKSAPVTAPPLKSISRSLFRKICRDELRLPITEEELRALLSAYDRELADEVNYMAFVQLNWTETQHQTRQVQRPAGQVSVTFQLDQTDAKEAVEDLAASLRAHKATRREVATALMNFSSQDDAGYIGEGEFMLAMRQLGVSLSLDNVRSIFQALAHANSRQLTGKASHDDLLRALGCAPDSPRRHSSPQCMTESDEGRKRLETAVQAAARYSQPAFQAAFARFQEFCVVHRFGYVPAPKLWQEMKANGFADLLSAKGVGLLAENFIAEHSDDVKEGDASSQVALKGVHAFLKRLQGVSGAEASALRRPTTTEGLEALNTSRRRSDVVHPLLMDSLEHKRDRKALISTIGRLVDWCESQGIDFRSEFEQLDRDYSGAVAAVQFKQVLLRLGLKQFADPAEGVVGELVREFRTPPPLDAVCYTAMLNQAIMPGSLAQEGDSCLSLSEELRARARHRAQLQGKIDQADPSVYTRLNSCFGHFDREKKGFLTDACLVAGLQALQLSPTNEQLHQLMRQMCVFRHADVNRDGSIEATVSRMEFDAFVLDPYGFRVLQRLSNRLFELSSSPREPELPRIALFARSLTENDAPTFSGALAKDVFFSLLSNALGRSVLETERYLLRHLFDVNRDARMAYKLFLKVMSQWRGPASIMSVAECSSPTKTKPKAAPCALHDVLSSLYHQLSSIDFDAQIEILNEYLQAKDETRSGLIKMSRLVRVFEQIGLSLSSDGLKSLEIYFSSSNDCLVAYDELLQELMGVHKENDDVKTSRK